MRRGRFAVYFFGLLLAGGALGIGGACSDPSTPGGSVDASTDGPALATNDLDALGKWCLDQESLAYEEWAKNPTGPKPAGLNHLIDGDKLLAAQALFASSTETMIPLSPSTCTRLVLTRDAGTVTRAVLVTAPFKIDVDKVTYEIRYRPLGLSEFTYHADGFTFRGDYDADDFYEVRSETKYEKSFIEETLSPTNSAVIERRSGAVVGPSAIRVVEEAMVGATLTTTSDQTFSLFQKACSAKADKQEPAKPTDPLYTDSHLRPCNKNVTVPLSPPQIGTKTVTEEQRIMELIGKAASRGSDCLKAAGMGADADRVVNSLATRKLTLQCMDDFDDKNANGFTANDEAFYAANDRQTMDLYPGKARLIVYGPTVGDPVKNPEPFAVGTIGHELFHFFSRHDPNVMSTASTAQQDYADQTTACEKLCFSSKPNMCHLAACKKKKISTLKADGTRCPGDLTAIDAQFIEAARGDGVTIAQCASGKQVGALCTEATQVMFCDNEADCKGACGGKCDSLSISCDPACK